MIYTNLVELLSLVLYAKFQDHRPFGSEEEDFLKNFLLFITMAAILVMWPGPFIQLSFPLPKDASHGVWPSGFRGEDA